MAGTVVRNVLVKVRADDGDTEEKLDAIALKADELEEKHPDIKVGVDTSDALAHMEVAREELKEIARPVDVEIKPKLDKHDAAEAEVELGVFAKLMGGMLGGGSGGGGIFAPLAEDGLGPIPAFLTSPAGIAAAVPIIAAVATELTGVVSGLAAAGAGAGAFAALAIPTLDKIKNAYTGITAAQGAYHAAVQLEAKDPTAANKTAVATALARLKIAEDNVSPSTRAAITGIDHLKSTYEQMATAFAPDVLKIFNLGLKGANELLPTMKPFADTAATALSGLLSQVNKFAGSSGFKQWLAQFQKLEGPSIKAIGDGLGRVATNMGKLLTSMSAKDVVHALNIAFDVISGTIKGLTFVVVNAMQQWDNLTRTWHDVMSVASSMSLTLGNVMLRIGHDVSNWAQDVGTDTLKAINFFRELPGRVVSALGNLGGELFSAGAHAVEMFADGIASEIGAVESAISHVASEVWDHIPHSPAKKGPLSGSGSPDIAGRKVSEMFATGIRSGLPAVLGSSAAMAHAAGLGGGRLGVAGAGGGGGGGPLQIEWVGGGGADQEFLTWLKRNIRIRGGDPSVLGR